jgi:hypothetical protein
LAVGLKDAWQFAKNYFKKKKLSWKYIKIIYFLFLILIQKHSKTLLLRKKNFNQKNKLNLNTKWVLKS